MQEIGRAGRKGEASNAILYYTQQKSSAQVCVRVNSVLTMNDCIKCYISLFKEIILQQLGAFQTEIHGSLMKMCTFKASRSHHSKVVKIAIMPPGAENMEYLNNPIQDCTMKMHLWCVINVKIWFLRTLGIARFNHIVPLSVS